MEFLFSFSMSSKSYNFAKLGRSWNFDKKDNGKS